MLRHTHRLTRNRALIAGLGLLAVGVTTQAQLDAPSVGASEGFKSGSTALELPSHEFATTLIVGHVVGPDGAPAVGAVVVTSAGGQSVTDADGAFSLDVVVPVDAEDVRVTAVVGSGTGSLIASAQVGSLAHWGTTSAGTLLLEQAATCQPSWLPTFGQDPSVHSSPYALTVFDDGSGPALYVGGGFPVAGGVQVNGIARWSGTSWSALGSGMGGSSISVDALAVFDDGSGPALYAGGEFTTAGGVAANRVAKWNGASWQKLGNGIGVGSESVRALAVFDDGNGPALYAGGPFTKAGGVTTFNIAKWNGTSWSGLGSGIGGGSGDAYVFALEVFDDGNGPALYAGGRFTTAGGVVANNIARWHGMSWSALGSGMGGSAPYVNALIAFDNGSGPALYAGGEFTTAGGLPANRVARWNGSNWSPLDSGVSGGQFPSVLALAVFDDGSGPALYAGGRFTAAGGLPANRVAKWNGSNWSPLDSGVSGGPLPSVFALAVFDDGSGSALYAGGYFSTAGGVPADYLAKWYGSSWTALGSGMNDAVDTLAVFDEGSGPALYAGGYFTTATGVAANRIAKWNGTSWLPLGSGIAADGGAASVSALTVFDDGSGAALYAGGLFTSAGGVVANNIAKWDGTDWSALSSGTSSYVSALTIFDDGNGPALYAGGSFVGAGGVPASGIAKWNGTGWSALGGVLAGGSGPDVLALTVFDDGSGLALYVGGKFTTAGGVVVNHIAKWNGSSWSALGSGMSGNGFGYPPVAALTVFNDGNGLALYAGGIFTTAGGVVANNIAKWNGQSWSALGSGMGGSFPYVHALTVFDNDGGPALYAGGEFTTAGGVVANRIAKWNGANWSPLGSGMGGSSPVVLAFNVFDDGGGSALYAGGVFGSAIDSGDSFLAKWGCPPPPVWTDLGFALPGSSGAPHLMGTGTLVVGTPMTLVLSNAKPSALTILFLSFLSTPLPLKGGTLVPVPPLYALSFATNAAGEIDIPYPAWPAGASGLSLYFQYAIQDAGAIQGVALSNALRADVP